MHKVWQRITTIQAMYVKHSIEEPSCNHWCSEKAIHIVNILRVCVCRLRYPACTAHAP